MANYELVTKSNYFHVKDEDAFSKFMDTVSDDERKNGTKNILKIQRRKI